MIVRNSYTDDQNEAWDAALEAAARLCDEEAALSYDIYRQIRKDIARRIRAMKRITATVDRK
jgi:hypothetical protein